MKSKIYTTIVIFSILAFALIVTAIPTTPVSAILHEGLMGGDQNENATQDQAGNMTQGETGNETGGMTEGQTGEEGESEINITEGQQ